jgi:hypothetical protein
MYLYKYTSGLLPASSSVCLDRRSPDPQKEDCHMIWWLGTLSILLGLGLGSGGGWSKIWGRWHVRQCGFVPYWIIALTNCIHSSMSFLN